DGLRDATVTGVQTCALPICQQPHQHGGQAHGQALPAAAGPRCTLHGHCTTPRDVVRRTWWDCRTLTPAVKGRGSAKKNKKKACRSEERRVGKEMRSLWERDI